MAQPTLTPPPSERRSAAVPGAPSSAQKWTASAFVPAALGTALWWLSLPPLQWSALAWSAPVAWWPLIDRATLPGRRPYLAIWCAGFLFWATMLQWLRHAHPAAAVGGLFLSAYLAVYLPAFVGLSRVAVHQWRVPAWLAAPLVWMGLETARAHLLTGFTLASLSHSQYRWLPVVQLAELGGAPLVSALVVLVGTSLAGALRGGVRGLAPLAIAALALGAAYYGGTRRLAHHLGPPGPTVALVQAPIKTEVKHDPQKKNDILRQYLELTLSAVAEHPEIELVIWPETMFRDAVLTWTDDVAPPRDADWTRDDLELAAARVEDTIRGAAERIGRDWIVGTDVLQFGPGWTHVYNSALLVDRHGGIRARYDKMHPVLFGEYVPLGSWAPWLYKLTPLPQGLTPGERYERFELGDTAAAVNICYELFVPHLLRRQTERLEGYGAGSIDWIVNLTNNGYYGGSWELELHLISAVFRAVELRRPVLVAANGGISAWVDGDGRIVAQAQRQTSEVLLARPARDSRRPIGWGDWPGGLCAGLCCLLAAHDCRRRWASRQQPAA